MSVWNKHALPGQKVRGGFLGEVIPVLSFEIQVLGEGNIQIYQDFKKYELIPIINNEEPSH